MATESLTREELLELCATKPDKVVDLIFMLLSRVNELTLRVQELEAQLNQNSRNSHKPPSSDGYKKPEPKSLRGKSGKSSGGQNGHPGNRLEMREDPDHVQTHRPINCEHCGHSLEDVAPIGVYDRRQVFDLIARIEVTEHRTLSVHCPACRATNRAAFPDTVPYPVQYGPGVKAFFSYGSTYQFLPTERLCEMLADLTGHQVSEGTVFNTQATLYNILAEYEGRVQNQLQAAPVIHLDESGLRAEGKTHWLHSASTADFTHYTVHPNRGAKGITAGGILPEYTGVAVHDGWTPYWTFGQSRHALCNVHHERELQAVIDNDHQTWAQDLLTHLHTIKATVAEAVTSDRNQLSSNQLAAFTARYREIIQEGLAENPRRTAIQTPGKRGRIKQTKTRNLLERLVQHQEEVLRFMRDFRVPYSNNRAEQDIRMLKVHQKIAGTFRSLDGAKIFCRIRGYISTLKKHGLSVMDNLQCAFRGQPYLPPTTQ